MIARHPEIIDRMRGMVQRGQLELLTGAYYEAILAVIPEQDRIGQIRKLSRLIRDTFGTTPRGMWLAERVWEPQLVSSIAKADVEFVMVDDTHFRHAGLGDDQLLGYYVTEDLGHTVNVLPIDKTLRYTVPFRPLSETFEYFRRVASGDNKRVVVHADDGEKFGVWPRTYRTVYEEGWLDSFCRMLEQESAWVKTSHVGTVVDLFPPSGRIYLPTASYAEMMKWALHAEPQVALERFEYSLKEKNLYEENALFVRAGFWRNFFTKYPEANRMHKKMLRVAAKVHAAEATETAGDDLLESLWAGQCNDPYWHGVFGGLYLPNLRFPVYRSLLTAEHGVDMLNPVAYPNVEDVDFDADGKLETVVESSRFDLCFTPATGASMIELSVKPEAVNLLDILTRREEGYHRKLREAAAGRPVAGQTIEVKETGLDRHLFFDWYQHGSLIDHFFGEGTTLQQVLQAQYPELGDFVNQPYTVKHATNGKTVEVTFERQGAVWRNGTPHKLSVQKTVTLVDGSETFDVAYAVTNREQQAVDLWFGIEWCFGSMAGDAPDRYYEFDSHQIPDRRLRSIGEEEDVRNIRLVDRWLKLQAGLALSVPATVWRFPIETVSLSEGGFERIYQGSVVIPQWRFRLEGRQDRGDKHVFKVGCTFSARQA
jgi:alpha-amylase